MVLLKSVTVFILWLLSFGAYAEIYENYSCEISNSNGSQRAIKFTVIPKSSAICLNGDCNAPNRIALNESAIWDEGTDFSNVATLEEFDMHGFRFSGLAYAFKTNELVYSTEVIFNSETLMLYESTIGYLSSGEVELKFEGVCKLIE